MDNIRQQVAHSDQCGPPTQTEYVCVESAFRFVSLCGHLDMSGGLHLTMDNMRHRLARDIPTSVVNMPRQSSSCGKVRSYFYFHELETLCAW